ncbi:MAG: family 10 glycosylhydrolase [Prevotellaceae bacterium]|jgi:uncharacterized lipoprotein YddW (UPF0748 family)|nr:family 10 glycosylhydrolase [Prevotellaceae bacterium]
MKKLIVSIILVAVVATNVYSQNYEPRREFRGAWVHTVGNQKYKEMTTDEMKKHFTSLLDEFEKAKINAVIFQVRPQADAFYTKSIEPWSRFITGTQGVAPNPLWDPLQFMVEECHKRGMELHAWFNPYRVTSNDKETLCDEHLYYQKPYLFVKYGKQIYFDPGEPEAREHTVKVITDVVTRYDIDAVHFDDYFYPYKISEQGKIVDFPDDKSFAKYGGKDGFTQETRNDWRRNNVNVLIQELNKTIKAIKPWVKFGISPFGIWRNIKSDPTGSNTTAGCENYDDLYADIKLWVQKRWIDYNVPQLYFDIGHPAADYETLIKWWSENNYGENLYIGQDIGKTVKVKSREKEGEFVNQLPRKMQLVRTDKNIHGNVWWSGYSMLRNPDGFTDSIINTYQTKIALMPQYKNIDIIAPDVAKNLKMTRRNSENYLTWLAPTTNDVMQKAAYYCIYIVGQNNEDISNKSPIAITQNTEFKITKPGIYAITVLDKLQNESRPIYININADKL